MDAMAMHRARLLPGPDDNTLSQATDAKQRRAPQTPTVPSGSHLERLAARFNALQAHPDSAASPSPKDDEGLLSDVPLPELPAWPALPALPTLPASPALPKSPAWDDAEDTPAEREPPTGANEDSHGNKGETEARPRTDLPANPKQPVTPLPYHAPIPAPRPSVSAMQKSPSQGASAAASASASAPAPAPAPAPASTSKTTVAAMASAFAMLRTAPPVTASSSGTAVGDAPPFIDGIVSRLADFCADPAVFERGAWHVTVPLQNVLPDCVLHVALSHFDLTLRFETSSDGIKNVLLQHASTLRDRLTALLKAKHTTPRGIEIIVR